MSKAELPNRNHRVLGRQSPFSKFAADGGFHAQQGQANSDDRPLPPDLAADLAPHLREALNHPVRRKILRALDARSEPRTLAQLALVEPGGGINAVHCHLRVLERCGCVSVSTAPPGEAESVWRYASNVSDDHQAIAVLDTTARLDELDG